MSTRQEDIQDLEDRIAKMDEKRKEIAEEFRSWRQEVGEKQKQMLVDAGLEETWIEIEAEIVEKQQEAQAKINPYNQAITQLNQFRSYLTTREEQGADISEDAITESDMEIINSAKEIAENISEEE